MRLSLALLTTTLLLSTATLAVQEDLCKRLVGFWQGKYVDLRDGSGSWDSYEVTKQGDIFKFDRVEYICPARCVIPPSFTATCQNSEIKAIDTTFTGKMTDDFMFEMKLNDGSGVLNLRRS